MRSLLIAIFCFCVLFAAEAAAQNGGGSNIPAAKKANSSKPPGKKKSVKESVYICQLPASVVAINFSQTEVPAVCPPDNSCTQIIEVRVTALDVGDNKYVYTVSGGKIIGSGANVSWDLSGLKPGTYIITAAIDEGSPFGILGRTMTKEVKVVE